MSALRKIFMALVALPFGASALAFERPEDVLMSLHQDQVTASFQRMLTHEPNSVAPAIPADFERDPLIDALAAPLLRWYAAVRKQTVAEASSDAPRSECPAVAATGPAALAQ